MCVLAGVFNCIVCVALNGRPTKIHVFLHYKAYSYLEDAFVLSDSCEADNFNMLKHGFSLKS